MTKRLSILKQPLFYTFNKHLIDYPIPSNISYWWGFGSLAGLCLVIQIITGVFLAMHYTPHVNLAFKSVEHIMRDVKGGWLLRYMHANGASMFFTAVYIHIFRGLYYGSYTSPREFIWCFGVVIFLLMIVTAFIGYVLPWGQMSFWGATVITSLASAVPKVGNIIVTWLWGGFSVDNATLNRFFSLHYLLPFAIVGVSIIHLAALHQYGSNNPLGIRSSMDKIVFYPYIYVKDLVGWVAFAIFFSIWLFYAPNALGHPDNYMPANPMSTPAHIVPEWYFLPIYAVLRSIPNKLGGVVAIGLVFVSLLALPFLNFSAVRSSSLRPIHQRMFCFFLMDCFLLTWVGCKPVEAPYVLIGQMGTSLFYSYFLARGYIYKMEYYIRNKYVPVDISTRGLGVLFDSKKKRFSPRTNSLFSSSSTNGLSLLPPDPFFHHHHHFCSSSGEGEGEGSNSDLSDAAYSGASFGERWSDHTYDLQRVASSLEKEGLLRDEHLKELKSVGSALVHTEIPDLDEVVNEAARERIEKDGTDKVAAQVQNVLSKLNVARNAAHFLQNEVEHLDKQAKKRMLPGEGEARASQLSQILNRDLIPAINDVIIAYRDLRQAAASLDSDSADNSMNSDADSGGGDGE